MTKIVDKANYAIQLRTHLPDITSHVPGLHPKTKNELAGPCPFCGGEDRFVVFLENNRFLCRGCTPNSGDKIDFFKRLFETDFMGLTKMFVPQHPAFANTVCTKGTVTNQLNRPPAEASMHQEHPLDLENFIAEYPYLDEEGHFLYSVRRYERPDGKKTFRQGQKKKNSNHWQPGIKGVRRVLYRLPDVLVADMVLVVEGEKDADALCELGYCATTNPMGAGSWRDEYAEFLADKVIIIVPDNDKPGHDHAEKILKSVRGKARQVVILDLPDLVSGEDVTDWLDKYGDKDSLSALIGNSLQNTLPDPPSTDCLPSGFVLEKNGLYYQDADKDGKLEKVCSHIRVIAYTRSAESDNWGRYIEVRDPDNILHHWAMPMEMTASRGDGYRAELLSLGLRLSAGAEAKRRLHNFLTQSEPAERILCTDRMGWYGSSYIFPDQTYGEQQKEKVVYQGPISETLHKTSGTLQEWCDNIGQYLPGNSRLIFAASAAFVGPLLKLMGEESGGVHFFGGSSIGKTTLVAVAGSIWGGGGENGYIKQWRYTDNSLEHTATLHNDGCLILDEVGQAASKVAGEVAYMLANGQGKGRAQRDGSIRKIRSWSLMFLSTGELSMADKIAEESKRAMAGQTVRVLDIPADAGKGYGIFDKYPPFDTPSSMADHLKKQSKQIYGTPIRTFIQRLTAEPSSEIAPKLTAIRDEIAARYLIEGVDGQVKRVCNKIALCAAAGVLAARYNILPLTEEEIITAAHTCFLAWLEHRGGTACQEVITGVEQVVHFFQTHGASRFEDLDSKNGKTINNRAGYIKKHNKHDLCFMVFPKTFRDEICKGYDQKVILSELERRGLFIRGKDQAAIKVRVEKKSPRLLLFPCTIIDYDRNSGHTCRNHDNSSISTQNNDSQEQEHVGTTSDARPRLFQSVPTCSVNEISCNSESVPNVPQVPDASIQLTQIEVHDLSGENLSSRESKQRSLFAAEESPNNDTIQVTNTRK